MTGRGRRPRRHESGRRSERGLVTGVARASRIGPPLRGDGAIRHRWVRSLFARDPGLAQLRTANRTACSITLALLGEWLFVRTTGALQMPMPLHATAVMAASIDAQHHDMLVVAMLLGGLVANLQGINGNELGLRSQLVTLAYIAVAVSASLALGLALGPRRDLALVVMVVLLVVGSAGRRFGPRGAVTGLLLFVGYFYGFFLSSALGVTAAGWLAAEVGVATAAAVAVRLAFFRPSPWQDLRLAMVSYDARVRTVLDLSARLAVYADPRARRRLQRWLTRLGEAALIVDGQLARGATDPATADDVHRRVFDIEVAVTNLARFGEMLGASGRSDGDRDQIRHPLVALADGRVGDARAGAEAIRPAPEGKTSAADPDLHQRWVLRHRFADALERMADALDRWPGAAELTRVPAGRVVPSFTPAVTLRGGFLPGTADVSVEASTLPAARVRVAPYVRTAAQMTVAVSLAIVAGDALDSQRFYWAVVAALLVLVGTNTVAEQLRKAAYRVTGTLAGIALGTALVEAVGHHSVWSLVTVVVVMWIGVAFLRVNYAVMAMAVTISLSQAYLSLGEFSNGLLWERLAETAVGAGAAMLTVLVVVPLRTRRVLDVALAGLVDAVTVLATEAVGVLSGATAEDLLSAGRAVDAAFQAIVTTAQPLRLVGWTDSADRVTTQLAAATAARNYSRNLVSDIERSPHVDPEMLRESGQLLSQSAGTLSAHLRGEPTDRTYVRSAGAFTEADQSPAGPRVPPLAIRDFALLDNALAALASASGLSVERPTPRLVLGGLTRRRC